MGWILITGPNGSGKSDVAEKITATIGGSVVYIATLPNLLIYRERIKRHQKRRPPLWQTMELIGHLSYDIALLNGVSNRNILFDGLSAYISRIVPRNATNQQIRCLSQNVFTFLTSIRVSNNNFVIVTNNGKEASCYYRDILSELISNISSCADCIIEFF
jgi:adenosyl cobinamide kinase/adenosyl cobinamide phosphate guanylyltransferase